MQRLLAKVAIGEANANLGRAAIDRAALYVERVAKTVLGVSSNLAEHLTGGRYINIDRVAPNHPKAPYDPL